MHTFFVLSFGEAQETDVALRRGNHYAVLGLLLVVDIIRFQLKPTLGSNNFRYSIRQRYQRKLGLSKVVKLAMNGSAQEQ